MRKGRRRSHETPEVEPDELEPVDVDGVRTVAILTLLWAVAFVVLAFRKDSLDASGSGWWLWTCLAGVGLGLLGLEYTRKRRDAIELALLQAEAARDEPDTESDAEPDALAQSSPPTVVADDRPAADAGRDSTVTRPIGTYGVAPQPSHPGPLPGGFADRTPPPRSQARQSEPAPPSLRRSAPKPEPPWSTPQPSSPAARSAGQPESRRPAAEPEWSAFEPPPAPEPSGGSAASSSVDDDEPLLETTLGGGRRARQYDMTEELDEITDGGGDKYRGRRARRSDSA